MINGVLSTNCVISVVNVKIVPGETLVAYVILIVGHIECSTDSIYMDITCVPHFCEYHYSLHYYLNHKISKNM